ncbi:MAG: glycosyltransferase, partial [Tepidisphaeraceae bacterium]
YGAERVAALVDADLFVLPSYQENFGMVVIESLAAGTPVIISDQVNIHDQISQAQVGEVIPTQVPPLADAISRWMGDAGLRAGASSRAPAFLSKNYDRRALAEQWVEHYARLAARGGDQPPVGAG